VLFYCIGILTDLRNIYSDHGLLKRKYAPNVSQLWINAGVIYIIGLLSSMLCSRENLSDIQNYFHDNLLHFGSYTLLC
ncbi:hypothetical protein, partial [Flavobacterium sp. B17]|uniref:hypothetical protein n=1 Tax=Flavobacterium sp. B17 TaxID=95618 RepID=UPI001A7E51ED